MSTTEPCPICEAWCCRDVSGTPVMHRAVRTAKHVCPDCDSGMVWTGYTEPASRPVRTAEDERADVLAYLAYARTFPFHYLKGATAIIDAIREHIEQGQHEGWAAKEQTP